MLRKQHYRPQKSKKSLWKQINNEVYQLGRNESLHRRHSRQSRTHSYPHHQRTSRINHWISVNVFKRNVQRTSIIHHQQIKLSLLKPRHRWRWKIKTQQIRFKILYSQALRIRSSSRRVQQCPTRNPLKNSRVSSKSQRSSADHLQQKLKERKCQKISS